MNVKPINVESITVEYRSISYRGGESFKVYYDDGFDTDREVVSLDELREDAVRWKLDEEDHNTLASFLQECGFTL